MPYSKRHEASATSSEFTLPEMVALVRVTPEGPPVITAGAGSWPAATSPLVSPTVQKPSATHETELGEPPTVEVLQPGMEPPGSSLACAPPEPTATHSPEATQETPVRAPATAGVKLHVGLE